jgi:outer membrane protein OmpA-like peptidoglycan-associated protein
MHGSVQPSQPSDVNDELLTAEGIFMNFKLTLLASTIASVASLNHYQPARAGAHDGQIIVAQQQDKQDQTKEKAQPRRANKPQNRPADASQQKQPATAPQRQPNAEQPATRPNTAQPRNNAHPNKAQPRDNLRPDNSKQDQQKGNTNQNDARPGRADHVPDRQTTAPPRGQAGGTQTPDKNATPDNRRNNATPDNRRNDTNRNNGRNDNARDQNRGAPDANRPQEHGRRLDDIRKERKETKEGNRTVIRETNRTIIRENNTTIIRHDDTDRFRRGGGNVQVQRRGDNTETVIVRPGGGRIVNVVDNRGRLVRRSHWVNGREVVLIDNHYRPGVSFIVKLPPPVIHIPRERYIVEFAHAPRPVLYETLIAPPVEAIPRRFTLDEIRYNAVVRERMPRIDIDTINFESGSWDVAPDQARLLEPIAAAMQQAIQKNPNEIYLVEGHTDAVGAEEDNLSLSDRRAEAVADILTEQFNIPPENLVTQGYGEQDLKVPVQGPEPRNRYVTVRRVTPLLAGQK